MWTINLPYMEKTLTIIIPTYNMEQYLDRCLKSLVFDDPLFHAVEILIINDGSKDRSSEIGHYYESMYSGVFRTIDKKNGNYGSCINVGLRETRGKYVKILDADDYFDTGIFPHFVEFLSSTEADCVISDMRQVRPDGSVIERYNFNLPIDGSVFELSALGDAADSMWMHCVCYRTEILRKISYNQSEGISYTDQDWIFLPMAFASHIAYYPNVVYNYLVGRDGQTINSQVWCRNFWQEIEGVEVMLREREQYKTQCSEYAIKYMDIRLVHRIKTIYYAFFLLFDNLDNNDRMSELDILVCEYDKQLYDNLEKSIVMFKFFHYVKSWRKSNRTNTSLMKIIRHMFRKKNKDVDCFFIR